MDLTQYSHTTYIVAAPLAFVVFLVGLVITLLTVPPSWDLAKENLSNLGGHPSLLTGICFTVTCFLAGALVAFFGLGKTIYEDGLDKTAGSLFIVSGISLMLVGLFNTNVYRLHMLVTLFFTTIVVIAICVTSFADILSGDRVMLLLHILTLILVLVQIPFFTGGAAELMSIIFGALWAEGQLVKYHRRGISVTRYGVVAPEPSAEE